MGSEDPDDCVRSQFIFLSDGVAHNLIGTRLFDGIFRETLLSSER